MPGRGDWWVLGHNYMLRTALDGGRSCPSGRTMEGLEQCVHECVLEGFFEVVGLTGFDKSKRLTW